MRKKYEFSRTRLNLYTNKLWKQISVWIDIDTIKIFKKYAEEMRI
jgi:hypothetical protein